MLAIYVQTIPFCGPYVALAHNTLLLRLLVLSELSDTSSSSANEPDGCVRHPHSQWEFCLFCHIQKSRYLYPLAAGWGGGGSAPFPTYDKTGWNATLTIHLHVEPPSTLVSSSGVCRINAFHLRLAYGSNLTYDLHYAIRTLQHFEGILSNV